MCKHFPGHSAGVHIRPNSPQFLHDNPDKKLTWWWVRAIHICVCSVSAHFWCGRFSTHHGVNPECAARSDERILWISTKYKINKCIFFNQRPCWLMWRGFDVSRLGSFCLRAACCQGRPGQTGVLTPKWPLEENGTPSNRAKAVPYGCCCLHLALPPSLPCLRYRRTAGGCGQPNQPVVQIKYLLAQLFLLKAK